VEAERRRERSRNATALAEPPTEAARVLRFLKASTNEQAGVGEVGADFRAGRSRLFRPAGSGAISSGLIHSSSLLFQLWSKKISANFQIPGSNRVATGSHRRGQGKAALASAVQAAQRNHDSRRAWILSECVQRHLLNHCVLTLLLFC
jgi:hypothetical protein